mmetsp:Transcript_28003/g.69924  ORF Transcript_28003/g.69924 Transcript_28003/m.69924 type:complete len:233 (+) Transcript_28003:283-981(+)
MDRREAAGGGGDVPTPMLSGRLLVAREGHRGGCGEENAIRSRIPGARERPRGGAPQARMGRAGGAVAAEDDGLAPSSISVTSNASVDGAGAAGPRLATVAFTCWCLEKPRCTLAPSRGTMAVVLPRPPPSANGLLVASFLLAALSIPAFLLWVSDTRPILPTPTGLVGCCCCCWATTRERLSRGTAMRLPPTGIVSPPPLLVSVVPLEWSAGGCGWKEGAWTGGGAGRESPG